MATKRLPTLPFLPAVPPSVTPQYASQLNIAINSFYRNIAQSVDEMIVTATHTSLFPAAKGFKRLAFNGSSLYIDWNTTSWTPIGATAPTSKFQAGFSTTASGATSGVTGTASRTLWMYPGPNITFSGATAADQLSLTIMGASGASGGGVAVNISGNTSGVASTYTSGTLCISAGSNITIGEGDQTLSIIGPTIPAATSHVLAISGNTSGIASTYTSGTVILSAGANITIGEGNQTLSIIGPAIPAATTVALAVSGNTSGVASTYTAGTVILSAGANITIGEGDQTLSIIGPTVPAVTAHSLLISGNTAGTASTYSSGSVVISAGSNVTISEGNQAITINAAAGGAGVAVNISGNTSGVASTYSSGTLCISGGANITIGEGDQSISIIGPTIPAATTIAVAISGNTSGVASTYTAGSLILSAGDNVTIGEGNQTLSIIAANPVSAGIAAIRIDTAGGTSGTMATITSGTWALKGGNNISIFQSSGSSSTYFRIQAPDYNNSVGISNLGNTAGVSGAAIAGNVQLYLAGGSGITLSQATATAAASQSATVTINGNSVSLSSLLLPEGVDRSVVAGAGPGLGIPIYMPFVVNANTLAFSTLDCFFSVGQATAVGSSQANSITIRAAILNTANPMVVQALASSVNAWTVTAATLSGTGVRRVIVPWTTSFGPGHYVLGLWSSSASSGNTLAITRSQMVNPVPGAFTFKGDITATTFVASNQMIRFYAVGAASNTGFSAASSVQASDLVGTQGSQLYPIVYLRGFAAV